MIFELRTYEAFEGRAEDLRQRLVRKIEPILGRYGIEVVGYWISLHEDNCITYMTRCRDEATLQRGWTSFANDEEWLRLKEETEPDGPLLKGITVRLFRQYIPSENVPG